MQDPNEPLFVAKPLLPDQRDVMAYIDRIWRSGIVTNLGELHNELEGRLKQLLKVPTGVLYSSGTTALLAAMRAFNFPEGSEIITTPLTFAATPHVITFCGFKPVFADVSPDTLTLDPEAVASAVTSRTAAVLGVHVYGTLCDDAGLKAVCARHGLKLIYDAAHAFGATQNDVPVGVLGDATAFSLHATKLYNTIEGGFLSSGDSALESKFRLLRNFGIVDEATVSDIGVNGKMSELHAAIGLLNLELFEKERAVRRKLREAYDQAITGVEGLRSQVKQDGVVSSEQYYLLVVDETAYKRTRDDIYEALKRRGIYTRRYFWPACTDYEPYKNHTVASMHRQPVVDSVKNQLLCLPFHSGVRESHIEMIAEELRAR